MKSQKPIQLVTAIFALTVLTTYVVQSQRHAAPPSASSPTRTPRPELALGDARERSGTVKGQGQGGSSQKGTMAGRTTPNPPSAVGTAPEPPIQGRPIGIPTGAAVAPGSKSMTPVMAVLPPSPFLPSNDVHVAKPGQVVLPGSKSAPVFKLQPKPRN